MPFKRNMKIPSGSQEFLENEENVTPEAEKSIGEKGFASDDRATRTNG
ncbi:MAG TPA: hypothetical protein VGG45_14070 [Terracidiphilus sp.]|jgi:hypothetical protein